MLGELELNLEDDSGTHEHGSGKEEKMEATGGSSAYYPKQAVSSEKASESAPATKAGEVKEKEGEVVFGEMGEGGEGGTGGETSEATTAPIPIKTNRKKRNSIFGGVATAFGSINLRKKSKKKNEDDNGHGTTSSLSKETSNMETTTTTAAAVSPSTSLPNPIRRAKNAITDHVDLFEVRKYFVDYYYISLF